MSVRITFIHTYALAIVSGCILLTCSITSLVHALGYLKKMKNLVYAGIDMLRIELHALDLYNET